MSEFNSFSHSQAQHLLNRLALAGWVQSSVLHEVSAAEARYSVQYTPAGRARMSALVKLIFELESGPMEASRLPDGRTVFREKSPPDPALGPLTEGELLFLRHLVTQFVGAEPGCAWPERLPARKPMSSES
jgi:hypothetical protein